MAGPVVWPALWGELRLGRLGLASPGGFGRGAWLFFPHKSVSHSLDVIMGEVLPGYAVSSALPFPQTSAIGQPGPTWFTLKVLCYKKHR